MHVHMHAHRMHAPADGRADGRMHAQAEELDVAPSVMDQVLHGCQRLTAEEIEAKVR